MTEVLPKCVLCTLIQISISNRIYIIFHARESDLIRLDKAELIFQFDENSGIHHGIGSMF